MAHTWEKLGLEEYLGFKALEDFLHLSLSFLSKLLMMKGPTSRLVVRIR